jgi:hypothetical protein
MKLVFSSCKKNNFITVNFLPGRLSGLDPRTVNAEIVVEKLAKGQVFLPQYFGVFSVNLMPQMHYTHPRADLI